MRNLHLATMLLCSSGLFVSAASARGVEGDVFQPENGLNGGATGGTVLDASHAPSTAAPATFGVSYEPGSAPLVLAADTTGAPAATQPWPARNPVTNGTIGLSTGEHYQTDNLVIGPDGAAPDNNGAVYLNEKTALTADTITVGSGNGTGKFQVGTAPISPDESTSPASVTAGDINVAQGYSAQGGLNIAPGSTVDVSRNLTIGDGATATGMGLVQNSSQLNVQGAVNVGQQGTGSLEVSGNGAQAIVGQSVNVGVDGQGTLDVNNGGTVSADQLAAATYQNSKGTVNVSGNGTALTTGSLLTVNGSGNGTVNVADGGKIVSGGQMMFGDTSGLGSGTVNVNAGGTLVAGDVAASSSLLGKSDGIVTTGSKYAMNMNGGTLQVRSGSNLNTAVDMTLTDGANGASTIDTTSNMVPADPAHPDAGAMIDPKAGNATLSGVLSGQGGLNKAGVGTLTLTGENTYTGATTVQNDGQLQLGNGGTTGTIANTSGINLAGEQSNLTINHSNDVALAMPIDGSGSISQVGSGTTTINGNVTLDGPSMAGKAFTQNPNALPFGSTISVENGKLAIGAGGNVTDKTENGFVIVGRNGTSAGLDVVNGGQLNVTNGTVNVGLAANSTGTMTVDGAGSTVNVGHSLTVGNGDAAYGAGAGGQGTLNVTNGGVVNADQLLTANYANSTGTVNVSGNGTALTTGSLLTVNGSGNGTVNVADGGKIVSGGQMMFGDTSGLGSGTVNVNAGGTLVAGDVAASSSLLGKSDGIVTTGSKYAMNMNGGTLQVRSGSNLNTAVDMTLTDAPSAVVSAAARNGAVSFAAGSTTASTIDTNGGNTGLSGVLSGQGGLNKAGAGVLTLSGDNSYAGATNVQNGTLRVDGNQSAATGLTTVASGATLGGHGTIGGNVVVGNGGTLSPGAGFGNVGTLTIGGNLSLGKDSIQAWDLGQADTAGGAYNDLVAVKGNLTLGGTLNVQATAGGPDVEPRGLEKGVYRVYTYGGTLSGVSDEKLGNIPLIGGQVGGLQSSIAHQVNLVIDDKTGGGGLTFWDGADPANAANGVVNGGNGVWTAGGNTSWTNMNGTQNAPWQTGGYAVFEGAAGTVTVKDTDANGNAAPVRASGMQFANNDGKAYRVTGDDIYATDKDMTIRVGDGTQQGQAITAVMDTVINSNEVPGGVSLTKSDLGTLVFTKDQTYTGSTTVKNGTLQLGDGGTTGALASTSGIDLASATSNLAIDRSNGLTIGQTISGVGSLTQMGSGTTTLTGENTYSGLTTVQNGTLQLGNGGTTGTIANTSGINLVNTGSNLTIDHSNDVAMAMPIGGKGSLSQIGSGTTTLNGTVDLEGGDALGKSFPTDPNARPLGGSISVENGKLAIGAGGHVTNDGYVIVGRNGTAAAMDIVNGGTLNAKGAVNVGLAANSTGTMNVDGAGSTMNVGNSLTIGNGDANFGAGAGGQGTLNVSNGGVVNADQLLTANYANSTGTVNVSGNGTALTTGSLLAVNGSGNGTVNVADGGKVVSGGQMLFGDGSGLGSGTVNVNAGGTLVAGDVAAASSVVGSSDGIVATGSKYAMNMNGGTLQVRSGSNLNTAVDMTLADGANGASTIDTNGGNAGLSGVLSGQGGMDKAGVGTLTLTGENTFSGATTVENGTLQLGNGGTTGTIANTSGINLAGDKSNLTVNHSNDVAMGQVISGAGSLTQRGTGVTTLTGENTFSGATTVENGTLQLGNGGTTGTIANTSGINLAGDQSNLTVNHSNDVAMGQVISGAGSLTQRGTGVTTLTGENTFSGATTVENGTLQLGNGGTTGTIANTSGINLAGDKSNLTVNHSNDVAMGQVISGAGSFTQKGTGVTTLTGDNTFAGQTMVQSGTLQLGNGGTTGSIANTSGIDVAGDKAVLAVNHSNDMSIGQTISGAGSLTQKGSGMLTLTGNNTYTGATSVEKGTLNVLGSTARSVSTTVARGATLEGTGTIGTANIFGAFRPGQGTDNRYGTMHVNGNVAMQSGSTMYANVGPQLQSTLASVSGTFNIASGSILNVTADQGAALVITPKNSDPHYTLVDAKGGVSGRFDGYDQSGLIATHSLLKTAGPDYTDPNQVRISVERDQNKSFSLGAGTRNQIASGIGLDHVVHSTGDNHLTNVVAGLSNNQRKHALDALSGEINASSKTAMINDSYYIRNATIDRLDCVDDELRQLAMGKKASDYCDATQKNGRVSVWGTLYGSVGNDSGSSHPSTNSATLTDHTMGWIMGADTLVNNWRVGGLLAYGRSWFSNGDDRNSEGSSNNVTIGAYGGTAWKVGGLTPDAQVTLKLGADYTWDIMHTNRSIRMPGYSSHVTGNNLGGTGQLYGESGYKFMVHAGNTPVELEPFLRMTYVNYQSQSFHEHGDRNAALRVKGSDTSLGYSTFGFKTATLVKFGRPQLTLSPHLMAAYRYAFGNTHSTARENFMQGGGGHPMDIIGTPLATNTALVEAGVTGNITDRFSVSVDYIGQYGNHITTSGGMGNISYHW